MKKNLLLKNSLIIIYCYIVTSCGYGESVQSDEDTTTMDLSWNKVEEIINSIGEFSFPEKVFDVTEFGAIADGNKDNTAAFKKAIETCSASGGGFVNVPAGKYAICSIHLENNVNLHLEKGAELLFSTNPKDYYPLVHTSFEGTELMNYSPLIYAYNKKNIAITGQGVLNGQATNENWWPWCGSNVYGWEDSMPSQNEENNRPKLVQMAEDSVPVANRVFGEGHYLRPTFIQPFECEKVLIKGITIINAPFWVIHPLKCENVLIDSVTINSHGPNNDGCDPEYSKNVWIKNSNFNTGDDCIAIKSGRNADGRRVAIKSENILIQNCNMIDGHGGIVMGSEISAGVSNVFVEDCTMDSPNLERAIRIKTNTKRGGIVENVYVRNIKVGTVKEAVLKVNLFYAIYTNQEGEFMPIVRNINLENVTVENGGHYGILMKGYKELPIKDITLKNIVIKKADENISVENVENLRLINTYINGELMQIGSGN